MTSSSALLPPVSADCGLRSLRQIGWHDAAALGPLHRLLKLKAIDVPLVV